VGVAVVSAVFMPCVRVLGIEITSVLMMAVAVMMRVIIVVVVRMVMSVVMSGVVVMVVVMTMVVAAPCCMIVAMLGRRALQRGVCDGILLGHGEGLGFVDGDY